MAASTTFRWDDRRVGELTEAIQKAFAKVVVLTHRRVIELMAEPKSGRMYSRNVTVSSAPGEAPAVQTSSYQAVVKYELAHFEGRVGSNDPRVEWLERGTSKMAPRPHLSTAIDETDAIWRRELKV